ncbi:MAG: capsular polysaccharide biosynthesis protein [Pseudomonadota bacterium]
MDQSTQPPQSTHWSTADLHPGADGTDTTNAAGDHLRRLFVYSGGLGFPGRVRRILTLCGWRVTTGWPGKHDTVGVWGRSPRAYRGEAVAARTGARLVRVEDAFLRSLFPGRQSAPPLGLMIDGRGVHFDSSMPSELETILATHALDDPGLLERSREGIRRMQSGHLSKYSAVDPDLQLPSKGFVLVVDQVRHDAGVTYAGAAEDRFCEMLDRALSDHPGARIVIKSHPAGSGYLDGAPADERVTRLTGPLSPWRLFEAAKAVYTVSSGLGFEAILAGHRPVVFAQPWYSGWGLSDDQYAPDRRGRQLTPAQLFAASMIIAPVWYDPFRDSLTDFETALDILDTEARAWRQDRQGWIGTGMRRWKHTHLRRMFGNAAGIEFIKDTETAIAAAKQSSRPVMAWASAMSAGTETAAAEAGVSLWRLEDAPLRSRGLGAALTPPMGLALDDLGAAFDPQKESRLEHLITAAAELPPPALKRSERLIERLRATGLTKYNTGNAAAPEYAACQPGQRRILVVGQVEDDASVLLGCGQIRTNAALLHAARAANPKAFLIYKPHPDVEAELREGAVTSADLDACADHVLRETGADAALASTDEVWTLTSTLGFEALLRELPVTCLGVPFYAGWGLTHDLEPAPARRYARPTLTALVHAVLIDYPRYVDPLTGRACPVEVIIDRILCAADRPPALGYLLAKLRRFGGLR